MQRIGARMLALAVSAIAFFASAGSAVAGEYPQDFCLSGSGSYGWNAWSGVGSPYPVGYCDPVGAFPRNGVYFNSPTLATNGYGGIRMDAPPGARYKKITFNLRVPYQATNRRTFVEANGAYVFSWWNGWGGTSSYNPDGAFFQTFLNDASYFVVGQACHGAGAGGCEAGDWHFSGMQATLVDTRAPQVGAHGEGLFDGGRSFFRGVVPTVVNVTDDGHGPAQGWVTVDGLEAAGSRDNWLGSCNYRLASPCPARLRWTRGVDTAAYADGIRTVKVFGDDGMGQSAFVERTVTFDNTPPDMGPKPRIDGKTVSADSTRLEVAAADATSGVVLLEASVDGAPWQKVADGRTGSLTVDGAGTHEVRLRATDRARNVSPEQLVTFTLQVAPDNQRLVTADNQPLPGAPGPGDVVKCDVGSPWTAGTSFAYRWLRDDVAVDGAVDQTYTVSAIDSGRRLSCRISAGNEAGTTERTTPSALAGTARCFGEVGPTQRCGDFDGDGKPNDVDPDDDNDAVEDGQDPAPFDPNVPGSGGGGTPAGSPGGGNAVGGTYTGPPNNGTNASNLARITVEGKRRRKVKFGRRIAAVARLRDELGRPITGAHVDVLERMSVPGAGWVPARDPVVSDDQGRLRWIIPAKYSRTIRYAYKANLRNTEFQSTSDLLLTVLAKSTFKASRSVARNGDKVTFAGRLKSRPVPAAGVLVDVQAKVGRRWQTFRTALARRSSGRWSVSYRFRSTRGVQLYVFRARVRRDTGYPYGVASTKTARVKVTG